MPVYIIRTDAYIEVTANSKDEALDIAVEVPNSEWELGEEWTVWKGEE
jgi:hypothetical protein